MQNDVIMTNQGTKDFWRKLQSFFFGKTKYGKPKSLWQSTLLQWIVSITVFLLLWQAICGWSGWVNPRLLPPPSGAILEATKRQPDFFKLEYRVRRGNFFNLPTTIYYSMKRVVLGLAIAFAASFIVGLAISYITIVRRLLLPIIRLLAPISPIAWLPLIQFFIGVGDTAIIAVIFVALFFILTLSTILSIQNVDKIYISAAKVLGANRWQIMLDVTIPAIIPEIFLALRMNFYAAWMSLLVAEYIGAYTGLGQMVIAGRTVFNMNLTVLGMVFIAIFGMLSETGLRIIQEKVLWWRTAVEI